MAETSLFMKCMTAGAAACFADLVTFPMDTAKVRLQIQGEGVAAAGQSVVRYRGLYGTMVRIASEEGHRALFNGLSAGLQRQLFFGSIRLGLYEPAKEFYAPIFDGAEKMSHGLGTRVAAGLTTGALAVLVAHPTDVVKVRYQAEVIDRRRPHSRKYSSTFQAYKIIATESGVKGLWKGLYPNVIRTAIINLSEAVCYDIVKDAIISRQLMKDSVWCHFSAAVVAGFTATVVASPVDVVKTRYMNAPSGQYSGALNCAATMARKEGATAFYKGFVPSFCRLVTWNICMWLTYEKLKQII